MKGCGAPELGESEEGTLADVALWHDQFAETQEGLHWMADQVRAEIRAGRTTRMVFTKDGRMQT